MRAVVMSIGAELLEGFITDTNATYLAQEMSALGIELVGVFQVGDNLERIVRAFKRGWDDADLIVTTGGIGPTDDDLTREAIAALLDEKVRVDPDLLAFIAAFFRSRSVPMPEQNSKQAWLIPSAEALPNPMGTAPGWFVRREKQFIVTMPGVPREMRRMWREQAVPRLMSQLGDQVFVSKTLKTIGIGESAAERAIADIIHRGYPVVATYAKDDGVHLRIVASAATKEPAEAAVLRTEEEIRQILADHVYGEESTSLGSALLAPLVASGDTLSIAESGSSGRITELISEEPAAVVHFAGGMIRAFEHSAAQHGIDTAMPDAPRMVAALDADAVRSLLRSDYGFAVSVRLTHGLTFDATHGDIALCLSGRRQRFERQHTVKTVPSEIRRRAAMWAAEFLRTSLMTDTAARR